MLECVCEREKEGLYVSLLFCAIPRPLVVADYCLIAKLSVASMTIRG